MAMALVVHGGAGDIQPGRHDLSLTGCRAAVLAGWDVLQSGGSAMDAATRAVVALENNPNFNAGTGCTLNSQGLAELDAGVMDGTALDVGRFRIPMMGFSQSFNISVAAALICYR